RSRASRRQTAPMTRARRRRRWSSVRRKSIRDQRASLILDGQMRRDRLYCSKTCSKKRSAWFDAKLRMCRKMRSQAPQRVVQPGFHRADRAVHHLCDLREVEAVHVVENDHQPMLWAERVDRFEDDPTKLRLFGEQRRGGLVIREGVACGIVEGGKDHVLARAAVVRQVDRDPIEPRPERVVGFEARERPMRPSERVDDDLLSRGGILCDRETKPENTVSIPVEERVERGHVSIARRVHELAVTARVGVGGGLGGLHPTSSRTGTRYRRIDRRRRSPPSCPSSTAPSFIGAWRNSVALVARPTCVTDSAPKNMRSPARASS